MTIVNGCKNQTKKLLVVNIG